MATRRKLIVVANRGPVAYARSPDGERVTRRGGGGLVTALRSLVAQHDVTWIASALSDEDRVVADEHGGEAFDETWRDGSPYRLRLVAHEPAAFDGYYNVVANPTLWFLHHYMWGLASEPDIDVAFRDAWSNGYVPVNEGFANAIVAELDASPDTAVFLHDYHLYLAPKLVRDARARCAADALHPHPVAGDGLLARAAGRICASRSTRACSRTTSSACTRIGGGTTFCWACEDIVGADVDHAASTVTYDGRTTLVTSHPIGIDPAEFAELAGAPSVLEQEQEIVASRPEFLVVRVDRTDPVEEHRARLPGVRALPRTASGAARARGDARAARSVAAGHPAVHRVPRRGRARGASRQRAVRSATGGCPSTCRSPTTSRSRSRRTSSTTRCSSTPSSTG